MKSETVAVRIFACAVMGISTLLFVFLLNNYIEELLRRYRAFTHYSFFEDPHMFSPLSLSFCVFFVLAWSGLGIYKFNERARKVYLWLISLVCLAYIFFTITCLPPDSRAVMVIPLSIMIFSQYFLNRPNIRGQFTSEGKIDLMGENLDINKSLEQLENDYWGEPEFQSSIVINCHRLRKVPLRELDHEAFRLLIGQNIGLNHLIPLALDILLKNPWAEGSFYEGDLLCNVLRAEKQFWAEHKEYIGIVEKIIAAVQTRLQAEATEEIRDIKQAIELFRRNSGREWLCSNVLFVKQLVGKHDVLKSDYDEHIKDNDGLLPHVFMGDLTRKIIELDTAKTTDDSAALILKDIIRDLEQGMSLGAAEVQELICVSFLENLSDYQHKEHIRSYFGKALSEESKKVWFD